MTLAKVLKQVHEHAEKEYFKAMDKHRRETEKFIRSLKKKAK